MVAVVEGEASMVEAEEASMVEAEEASMVEAEEASTVEAEEASTVVAASMEGVDFLAVAQAEFTVAAATAEPGRSAEEHIPGVTGLLRTATPAHCKIIRRTFVPPSTMANGIRSATLVAPVWERDAPPEV